MTYTKLTGAFLMACAALSAQGPGNQGAMPIGSTPIFRVTVTARTAKAISYRHRSGSTKIDFKGTEILPGAHGDARVESKQGRIEIDAEFSGLEPATKNGAEYLTYVLWAITPEGRPVNLGEVLLNGTKSKLNVTTELQVFGLIVTAEPYYAVTQPSDYIVMENEVRADTLGKIEEIDAKYELLQRGQYQRLSNPLSLKTDKKLPLELYEARNAVQISRAMGADRFAAETFQKAEKSLSEAEAYQSRKAGRKPVAMTARAAVQTAEDARAIAVKRQEGDLVAAEKQQLVDREARAERGRVAAQSETNRVTRDADAARIRAQAETDRLTREKDSQAAIALAETNRLKSENESRTAAAGIEADRLRLENEARTKAAKAEADHLKFESDSRLAAAGVETARLKAENETRAAASKTEADRVRIENESRMAAADAEANRLKMENAAQKAATQSELDNAVKQKARLETEKAELRTLLLTQFNVILQTRDTARGLIVNMSDVLFDTGKFTLRPLAREKLAKVAGIVSGHPGLKLDVEGHTDSVGGDAYNQQLSEKRGGAVRDYLTQQGMPGSSVTSKGLGKAQPVASNDTASGRQQNRRVEIVISGEVIGTEIGIPIAAK